MTTNTYFLATCGHEDRAAHYRNEKCRKCVARDEDYPSLWWTVGTFALLGLTIWGCM